MSAARSEPLKSSGPLFGRHRQLLAFLDAIGGHVHGVDFQKLLFLYCQEEPGAAIGYEFIPYKYGAFSFTCYADRRRLVERGLLVDASEDWQLTELGREIAGYSRDLHVSAFARRHRQLRGDALVAETYRRFPFYATRSEIAARVLCGDAVALQRIDEARRPATTAFALTTIGYEGRVLENYLNELLRAGITLLCDVRRNAISRKYGFSKSTLAKGAEGVGIQYEHLPELGIPSERRQSLADQADYDALFAHYVTESLPLHGASLEKIRGWIQSGERVALTCFERLPQQCHRHCVAEALEASVGNGIVAKHL